MIEIAGGILLAVIVLVFLPQIIGGVFAIGSLAIGILGTLVLVYFFTTTGPEFLYTLLQIALILGLPILILRKICLEYLKRYDALESEATKINFVKNLIVRSISLIFLILSIFYLIDVFNERTESKVYEEIASAAFTLNVILLAAIFVCSCGLFPTYLFFLVSKHKDKLRFVNRLKKGEWLIILSTILIISISSFGFYKSIQFLFGVLLLLWVLFFGYLIFCALCYRKGDKHLLSNQNQEAKEKLPF